MTTVWTILTKLEITLASLLSAQAVLVAFFPQTPDVLQWTSRVFGALGFAFALIKVIMLANGQPVPSKPVVK